MNIHDHIRKVMDPLVAALRAAGITGEVDGARLHIPTKADCDVQATVHFERSEGWGPPYNFSAPFIEVVNQRSPFHWGFAETFRDCCDHAALAAYVNKLRAPPPEEAAS